MNLPSKLIEEAVDQLSSIPGIGRKTALRHVLSLLQRSKEEINLFSNSFVRLRNEIKFCEQCGNLSDLMLCLICSNPNRNHQLICVVEDLRDIMAIESTQQFQGVYHVLGGKISPMDGIGPNDLNLTKLPERVKNNEATEVILALSATMEGDTTSFYIFKKLKEFNIKLSSIARGVGIGDELEYTDEITLGRSIVNRIPYENSLS
ncbi:MAG: recombination protein RecR [Flavobacteriales bacterium]|jgi:recombination protein RecR